MRRLLAVLFTDIVGSTATMQADEIEAHRLRSRHRAAVDEATARWRGEVVQYYGDGSLSVFDSAVDAVRCAVEIQQTARREPSVPLRIGVHSGDVVRDEGGVFGDSVNVAARLESLCPAGGVLVSDKVHDEIKNQRGLETVWLGTFHLRNVAEPTGVHAVAHPELVVPRPSDLTGPGTPRRASVAVLPFANLSSDPENAWFADGLAEELINALTRVPGLKVTARTSSFAFRDRGRDVREIARALDVGAVLEGSVRRAGRRVRLSAQLVDAADGFHLFSEVYDRTLDDVFAVQDEVARTIVRELEPRLLDTPSASLRRRAPAGEWKAEAYNLLLRARAEIARWTPESMRAAIDFCRRAAAIDPARPEPWSTLSMAYVFLGGIGHLPPDEAYPAAEEAIGEALARDPDDAIALTSRALHRVFSEGDGAAALRAVDHALTVAPGLAFAHQSRAYVLLHERRFDEAVAAAEAAVELDPLSPPLLNTLGTAFMTAGRLEEARAVLTRALAIAPSFRSATQLLAWTHMQEGDLARATELMESLPDMAGFESASAGPRGFLYARTGRPDRARAMLRLLEERAAAEPRVSLEMDFAMVHLGLGELDVMVDYLERAKARNRGALYFLRWAGLWDEVRDHPRVRKLLGD